VHGPGQGLLVHDDAFPDPLEELVLGNDAIAVAKQVEEEIEDLGLELHRLAITAELVEDVVQLELGEAVDHGAGATPRVRDRP
jgi:hypothetical protein